MNTSIKEFIEKFNQIKRQQFTESLRKGYTGIGYTYETIIGKKEDNKYYPDYKGIEIKTKLGYSKSNITLFTLVPQSTNGIKYIYDHYSYPNKENKNFNSFRGDCFCQKNNFIGNKLIFKIKINYIEKILELNVIDRNLNVIDNSIYWTFDELKNRLYSKLNTLSLIKGYPYKKGGKIYYKYTSNKLYRLKGFNNFLQLIAEDKIYITFNIGVFTNGSRYGQIHDRGTAFKICNKNIGELFTQIN